VSEESLINSVLAKLLEARKVIKNTKIKKEGNNSYSNYDYFTPDQVSNLVNDACQKVGIIPMFSLERDEIGYFGRLITLDVDTGHFWESIMRTEIPEIKATNATQKMGGAYTYTKRYMLMNEFDIADNNLDFDSQDNRPSSKKETEESQPKKLTLKKKHVSSEEVEKTEEVEQPKVEEKSAEQERIEELRSMCDELGIKYTKRHKEAGLMKLIEEHNIQESTGAPFEGGEDVEEADPYVGEPEDEEVDLKQEYLDSVDAYTDSETLFNEAKSIISAAEESGMPEDDIEEIKLAINKKYKALKNA